MINILLSIMLLAPVTATYQSTKAKVVQNKKQKQKPRRLKKRSYYKKYKNRKHKTRKVYHRAKPKPKAVKPKQIKKAIKRKPNEYNRMIDLWVIDVLNNKL